MTEPTESENVDASGRSNDEEARSSEAISVSDLALYIRQLSKLNENPATGNVSLAHALAELATVIMRHSGCSLSEFLAGIASPTERPATAVRVELPPGLAEASAEEIRTLLSSPGLSKSQLIEVGFLRFGIPKGGSQRRRKEDIAATILSALEHEESLRIISQQARQAGADRSS